MKRFRLWIAATFVWVFVLASVERVYEPAALTSLVHVFALLCALPLLLVKGLRRIPAATLIATTLPVFLVTKAFLGFEVLGSALPTTVTQLVAVGITLVLARGLAELIDEFEEAVGQNMTQELPPLARSFDQVQGDIYTEIRRARSYERSLSLLAIGYDSADEIPAARVHELIATVQRESLDRYLKGHVGQMLAEEIRDHDVVALRNGHFIAVLPETESEEAMRLANRLRAVCQDRLGVELRVGISSFPKEEVTFEKLLETAEADMGEDVSLSTENSASEEAELTG